MTASDTGGVVPALSAADLLAAVPGLAAAGIAVDAVSVRSKPGASLTAADVAAVCDTVRARLAAGATGVVVTQGTDTIEETAYLLDLLHGGPQPVVVTGAMRNPELAGADGPANLLAAVTVAASPAARDLGCLVVFADEVHAARRVRKAHSTGVAAFDSPGGGPLGYLVEGVLHLVQRPVGRFTVPAAPPAARVAVVPAALDDDGVLLPGLGDRVQGVVVAGFGVGHVPASWLPALDDLVARVPVVLASRTGAGPVLASTYGFAGSERDLLARGLIGAGLLDAYKARHLLRLCLDAGADRSLIGAAFAAAGGLEAPDRWPWPGPRRAS